MRPLSVPELLDVWERGQTQSTPHRALLLLAAAAGGSTDATNAPDKLAQLSIGQRDARLLALRELTFGSQLTSVATCPACGETIEAMFDVADLLIAPVADADDVLSLNLNGEEILFRLPNTQDQIALADCSDVATARDQLLRRCLLSIRQDEANPGAPKLSPDAQQMIAQRMEEADPQADIQLKLDCGRCGHIWQIAFDIGSFFWRELDAWAQRLLTDVHALATAYGWHERDILSMSGARRQFYLDRVNTRH
jgi:hypothetical protein